jgi:predicted CxxxxCH...CXXCH cytochrome family protein
VHNAFPQVTNVCDTCHSGAGTGTQNHFNTVIDVLILSTYNAKSGAAVRNADGTCSSVSCHGGQTAPAWLTGVIDVDTQCASCHAFGSTEYNSYSSGQHDAHVNTFQFPCTRCHDTSKLAASHFTRLDTTTMEGPASATLSSSLTYTGGSCTPLCHGTRNW